MRQRDDPDEIAAALDAAQRAYERADQHWRRAVAQRAQTALRANRAGWSYSQIGRHYGIRNRIAVSRMIERAQGARTKAAVNRSMKARRARARNDREEETST